MTTLLGISGALRRGSYNASLLRAAVELAPEGVTLDVAAIREIPLYDGDVESEHGIPEAVTVLKDRIAAADGLLLVTPEYNNGIPGVFKNVIDWCSRPPKDLPRVFGGKPVAVIGATPGPGGTAMAQAAWLPVLKLLGAQTWSGGRVVVSGAGSVFDAEGRLTDEALRTRIRAFLSGFAEFAGRMKRST